MGLGIWRSAQGGGGLGRAMVYGYIRDVRTARDKRRIYGRTWPLKIAEPRYLKCAA